MLCMDKGWSTCFFLAKFLVLVKCYFIRALKKIAFVDFWQFNQFKLIFCFIYILWYSYNSFSRFFFTKQIEHWFQFIIITLNCITQHVSLYVFFVFLEHWLGPPPFGISIITESVLNGIFSSFLVCSVIFIPGRKKIPTSYSMHIRNMTAYIMRSLTICSPIGLYGLHNARTEMPFYFCGNDNCLLDLFVGPQMLSDDELFPDFGSSFG